MRLRRAAPAAAGFIAVALIALTAWLEVPVTRALGIAALIIAASMLTPVKPLDGAAIAKAGAAGASLAALGLGALAFLGKAKATVWAEASEFNAYVEYPASEALRAKSAELLHERLISDLLDGEQEWLRDDRDLMVALAPFHDCARRLGLDVSVAFREATGKRPESLRDVVTAFGERRDVTPEGIRVCPR